MPVARQCFFAPNRNAFGGTAIAGGSDAPKCVIPSLSEICLMNSLAYFDIQVINLPSRTDRREEFGRQLSAIGMSYADVRLFSAVRPEGANGFPSVGTLGCFLSHLGALRGAEPGRPALICEDDLNFSGDFLRRVDAVVDRLRRAEWGMFYGGHDTFGEPVHDMEPFRSDKGIRFAHMIGFNAGIVPRVVAYLEAILGRGGGHPTGGPMHVDGAYSWFRRDNPDVVTRLALPQLGIQRRSRTDVHDHRWHDRTPLIAQALTVGRRLANRLQR